MLRKKARRAVGSKFYVAACLLEPGFTTLMQKKDLEKTAPSLLRKGGEHELDPEGIIRKKEPEFPLLHKRAQTANLLRERRGSSREEKKGQRREPGKAAKKKSTENWFLKNESGPDDEGTNWTPVWMGVTVTRRENEGILGKIGSCRQNWG